MRPPAEVTRARIADAQYVIKDFDWTAKLVTSVDCSLDRLYPIVQLKLHCVGKDEPLVYEFTPEEVRLFFRECRLSSTAL
ncbi:hypothetical protein AAVH_10124 [Aphelenchoides avenae]|nr:hypothetical protein AAVH_10124 [Aphelenchus avenae]